MSEKNTLTYPRMCKREFLAMNDILHQFAVNRIPYLNDNQLRYIQSVDPDIYKFLLYFPYTEVEVVPPFRPNDIQGWFLEYLRSISYHQGYEPVFSERGESAERRGLALDVSLGEVIPSDRLHNQLREYFRNAYIAPSQVYKLPFNRVSYLLKYHTLKPLFTPNDVSPQLYRALVKQREMELQATNPRSLEVARDVMYNRDSLLQFVNNPQPYTNTYLSLEVGDELD